MRLFCFVFCVEPQLQSLSLYRFSISRSWFSLNNWRVRGILNALRRWTVAALSWRKRSQRRLDRWMYRVSDCVVDHHTRIHRQSNWISQSWSAWRCFIHLANIGVCPITELVLVIDLGNVAAAAGAAELLRNRSERPYASSVSRLLNLHLVVQRACRKTQRWWLSQSLA